MKITFLGSSHGIAEKNRYCSSIVVTVNGKHYVIDAGAPILDLLQRNGFAFEDVNGIFITHMHSDHMIGLYAFMDTLNEFNEFSHIKIPVYAPDLKRLNAMVSLIETCIPYHGRVTLNKYEEGVVFDDGNVKISSVKTQHIENSHAFIVEADGKKVVFTGDLTCNLTDYPKIFNDYNNECDLVVMESAHQFYSEDYVYDTLSKTKTKAMVLNHVYELRNSLEILTGFASKIQSKFPLTVAYDGMIIEL